MSDQVLLELKRNWFGPDGTRYREEGKGGKQRHRVPLEVAVQAPSDAKVYDLSGKFLGLRKDWSQEAEASAKATEALRVTVNDARKKAVDAAASLTAAEVSHKNETDADKKKQAAEGVKNAKADADAAKKELDDAIAALEAASPKKD